MAHAGSNRWIGDFSFRRVKGIEVDGYVIRRLRREHYVEPGRAALLRRKQARSRRELDAGDVVVEVRDVHV